MFVILCKYISFRSNTEIIVGGQSVLPFYKNILYFIWKITISGKYSKAHTSLVLAQAYEIYVICLSYMRCRTCSFKKLTCVYLPLTFYPFCFSISSFIFSFHIYIFIFIWGVINIYVCINMCMRAKSLLSCQTLCNPVDCSLPSSSVHGILQTRILNWVAMTSSRL